MYNYYFRRSKNTLYNNNIKIQVLKLTFVNRKNTR